MKWAAQQYVLVNRMTAASLRFLDACEEDLGHDKVWTT